MKRTVKVLLVFVFAFAFALSPAFKPHNIRAAAELKLEETSLTLDTIEYENKDNWSDNESIYITEDSCSITSVDLSEEAKKIVKVDFDSDHITVCGIGVGTCTFTVIGTGGSVEVTVTITNNFMNEKLFASTEIYNNWYGTPKIGIKSMAGANIKMTIGGDTYTVKIPDTGRVYIPLKKVYKPNTKIKVEISKAGGKATESDYIYSKTNIKKAAAKKKTIKVKFFDLHKGDVLKLKYSGKVYTKKVKKNYSGKNKVVAFKVKSKVKPKKKFSVKVTNKYKQSLVKATFKTKKGTSNCSFLSIHQYYPAKGY